MTNKEITKKLVSHYEATLAEHGDSEKGHDWQEGSEWNRFDVMLDIDGYDQRQVIFNPSYLDYGCGTGRLSDYVLGGGLYADGSDPSEKMAKIAASKGYEKIIHGDIHTTPDEYGEYDYTMVNGVFTQKLDIDQYHFTKYVFDTLEKLWKITRRGLAVNFMSTVVTEMRDNLYHLDMEAVLTFAQERLGTRNVVFRNDYGLFEYTAYIYK